MLEILLLKLDDVKKFSAYYFFNVHLPNFSKIKSHKDSQKSRNQGLLLFLLDDRKIRIRIRIQKAKHINIAKMNVLFMPKRLEPDLDPEQ